jgi:hypothetical protein
MIYILEIPHQLPPKVWSRSNKEQIMTVINEVSARSGDPIYEESTGRDLLEMFGYDSTSEMREDNDALTTTADLIDTHGLDATFYKGYGDEEYGVEQVDEWESYLEWNGRDLSTQRVYMSDGEARAALADDSQWRIHQGVKARIALKKELETFGE